MKILCLFWGKCSIFLKVLQTDKHERNQIKLLTQYDGGTSSSLSGQVRWMSTFICQSLLNIWFSTLKIPSFCTTFITIIWQRLKCNKTLNKRCVCCFWSENRGMLDWSTHAMFRCCGIVVVIDFRTHISAVEQESAAIKVITALFLQICAELSALCWNVYVWMRL